MKKIKYLALGVVLVIAALAMVTGCTSYGMSDSQYYFSDASEELVAYDSEVNTLDEAGYFYYFTSNINDTVTIDINITLASPSYQAMYFYLNGVWIQSDSPDAAYTHKFADLTLTKGDKLTFHIFATNSLMEVEAAPTIQVFTIDSYKITDLSAI